MQAGRRSGAPGKVCSTNLLIYVLPGHEHNQHLLRHERKHLEQIERDGRVLFSIRYLYWLARHGYWNNPYEVEARAAEWKSP